VSYDGCVSRRFDVFADVSEEPAVSIFGATEFGSGECWFC